MSLKINNNIIANTRKITKSTNKISTGLKINKASDDAAGLAISEKMRSQIRGLDKASKNIQDGISLTQVAQGAMQEQMDIVQRIRELAVKSANGTNSNEDREKIQVEVTNLLSEIETIASETNFNGKHILNGDVVREIEKVFVDDPLNGIILPQSLTNFFTTSKFNNYEKPTGASVSLDFKNLTVDDIKNLNNTGFKIVDENGNTLGKFVFTENVDDKSTGMIPISIKDKNGNYLDAKSLSKNIANAFNSSNNFERISTTTAETCQFDITIKSDSKYVGEAGNKIKFEGLSMNSIGLPSFINNSTKFSGGVDGNKASITLDFSDYNDELSISKLVNKSIKFGNEIFVFTDKNSNIDPKYKTINIDGLTTNQQLLQAISNASFSSTFNDNGDYVKAFEATDLGNGQLKIEYVKSGTTGNSQSISDGIDKDLSGKGEIGLVPPVQSFTGGVNEKPPADADDVGIIGQKASYTVKLDDDMSKYLDKGFTLSIGSSIYSKVVFTSGYGVTEDKDTGIVSIGIGSGNLDYIKDIDIGSFIINGDGKSLKIEYKYEGTTGNSFKINDGIKGYDDIKSLGSDVYNNKLVNSLGNLSGGVNGEKASTILDFSSYNTLDEIKKLIGTGFTLPNGQVFVFTDGQSTSDRGNIIDISGISSAKDLTRKIKSTLGYGNYDSSYTSSTEIKITYHKAGSEGNDKIISQVSSIKPTHLNQLINGKFTGGKEEEKAHLVMDFGAYFLSKLDLTKDIESQLDGKGFRIDCSTCENEWINIQFVTDDSEIHPDNIGVNIKGVKSAEDLVNAIMNQTENAGKLNHYTHFKIDPNDSTKLIVYDNRTDRGNNAMLHDGIKTKKVEKEIERYMSTIIIQSGANSNENITIEILNTNTEHLFKVLSKDDINVENYDNALNTIALSDNAINYLNKALAIVGSYENRLGHMANIVENTSENLISAKSKITDVDIAKEIMNLSKLNLLAQASQVMMKQCKAQSEYVMEILK